MCIMAFLFRSAKNTPILVAANREEFRDRPTQIPRIQSGTPRVICGIDRQAGGTWFGVNQHGLFSSVTNRRKTHVPANPRSRGLLCRELLENRTAKEAAIAAVQELETGNYAGANYVVGDGEYAAVIHGGNQVELVELDPGLHIISDCDVDDRQDERQEYVRRMLTLHKLDSSVTFLAVASRAFSRPPDGSGRRGAVTTGGDFGTVSSTLLSLPNRIQQAVYQYTPGPPCDMAYDDLSALLRQVLSADKSRRAREASKNGENAKKASGKEVVRAKVKAKKQPS